MIITVLLLVIPVAGCGEKLVAQDGDVVKVHYTGLLEDGTVFDTTAGGDPFEFTLGSGEAIKGFDDAVRGMKVGDYKEVTIPPEEAYGEPSDDLIFQYPVEKIPAGANPQVGDKLPMTLSNGTKIQVTVVAVNSENLTLDANPELAGKTLIFKIELMDIERNSEK